MKTGDKVVLSENTIVVDVHGADYLLKGTEGILKADNGDMLIIAIPKGANELTYEVPAASVKAIPKGKAA